MGAKIPHMVALLSIIRHSQTAVLQPWLPLCGKVRCRTAKVLPGSRGSGHRDSDPGERPPPASPGLSARGWPPSPKV